MMDMRCCFICDEPAADGDKLCPECRAETDEQLGIMRDRGDTPGAYIEPPLSPACKEYLAAFDDLLAGGGARARERMTEHLGTMLEDAGLDPTPRTRGGPLEDAVLMASVGSRTVPD